jgi:hypothetical protein
MHCLERVNHSSQPPGLWESGLLLFVPGSFPINKTPFSVISNIITPQENIVNVLPSLASCSKTLTIKMLTEVRFCGVTLKALNFKSATFWTISNYLRSQSSRPFINKNKCKYWVMVQLSCVKPQTMNGVSLHYWRVKGLDVHIPITLANGPLAVLGVKS